MTVLKFSIGLLVKTIDRICFVLVDDSTFTSGILNGYLSKRNLHSEKLIIKSGKHTMQNTCIIGIDSRLSLLELQDYFTGLLLDPKLTEIDVELQTINESFITPIKIQHVNDSKEFDIPTLILTMREAARKRYGELAGNLVNEEHNNG